LEHVYEAHARLEHVFVYGRNQKGNVAEAAITAAAIKLGVDVIKPLVEHTRYDLIIDLRPRLLRVQCKWAPLKDDVVAAAQNGQRASLHWARDYELPGAVAQLGERRRGTPEATGSSPVSSTGQRVTTEIRVGAHEFRNLFGWYAERAPPARSSSSPAVASRTPA
jgi:hypothetical protein